MDLQELEERLEAHGKKMKSAIAPPFLIEEILKKQDGESEAIPMTIEKTTKKSVKTILLAAALVCAMSATAFAAYQYLTAGEVADKLGDKKLATQLAGSEFAPQTMTDGDYQATVLGVTSGANISDFQPDTWDVAPGNTYAVVAVEKTDGTLMTWDNEILVTPLIQGLTPWQYNIFTMHGGFTAQIIDGVLYRIVEFDDIQCFADREVYLAVLGEGFLDNSSYAMDETTGVITPKADYEGTNLLFKLPLDQKKADPAKAEQVIKALDDEMRGDNDNDNNEDMTADENIGVRLDPVGMEETEIEAGEDVNTEQTTDDGILVTVKSYEK